MKLIFRVDSAPAIGLGHIMRSAAIANELRRKYSAEIIFASNPHPFLETKLENENYAVYLNKKGLNDGDFIREALRAFPCDMLFIDCPYEYSPEYIESLKAAAKVCLLENFSEGVFNADYAIFPSAHLSEDIKNDKHWNASGTSLFYGPEFVVINDAIKNLNSKKPSIKKKDVKHLIITTGGSDPKGIALRFLRYLMEDYKTDNFVKFIILLGRLFVGRDKIDNVIKNLPENIEIRTFDPSIFLMADLAVCSFGVTAYELIYLGIPILTVANTVRAAKGANILAEQYGVVADLGFIDDLSGREFKRHVRLWLDDSEGRRIISRKQRSFIDGKGAQRIAEKLYQGGF